MDRSPAETIQHIASYICQSRAQEHRPLPPTAFSELRADRLYAERLQAQRALSNWSQASKHYRRLVTPFLLLDPLLPSYQRAQAWAKVYLRAVSQFALSGSRRPLCLQAFPTSLELRYGHIHAICRIGRDGKWEPVSYTKASPPPISVPLDLGLFSSLRSITLAHVHLDTDFLPRLVGPGSAGRPRLESLRIIKCSPAPFYATERTLSFLFDLFCGATPENIEAAFPIDHFDTDEFRDLGLADIHPDHHDELDVSPPVESRRRSLYAAARTDWVAFCHVWVPRHERETASLFSPSLHTPVYPFSALITLQITIPDINYLNLIFDRPSFPSLRILVVEGTRPSFAHVSVETFLEWLLPAFRFSISRNTEPGLHEDAAVFRPPDGVHDVLMDLADFLTPQKTVVPMTPFEQLHFRPYCGPKLDWLDLSGLYLVYG